MKVNMQSRKNMIRKRTGFSIFAFCSMYRAMSIDRPMLQTRIIATRGCYFYCKIELVVNIQKSFNFPCSFIFAIPLLCPCPFLPGSRRRRPSPFSLSVPPTPESESVKLEAQCGHSRLQERLRCLAKGKAMEQCRFDYTFHSIRKPSSIASSTNQ